MVVEVIAEGLNVRDDIGHSLGCKVPGEQDWQSWLENNPRQYNVADHKPKVTYPISPVPVFLTPGTP